MAIDDQLAVLLAQNADLFAAYEEWANGQIMLLAGTVDDPNSFNADGGKTGALGYYPVLNVSGQTIYMPCIARLKALALGGANAETLEILLAQVGARVASADTMLDDVGEATALAVAKTAQTEAVRVAAQNVVNAGASLLAAVPAAEAALAASTAARDKAQAWSEGILPGGAGTKSAKEWAQSVSTQGIADVLASQTYAVALQPILAALNALLTASGQAPVATVKPAISVAPAIAGTPSYQQTITCSNGTWGSGYPFGYTYQWLRDGAPINGATSAAYTIGGNDVGHSLACAVTAVGPGGSTTITSGATPQIGANPLPAPFVDLFGTPDGLLSARTSWAVQTRTSTPTHASALATAAGLLSGNGSGVGSIGYYNVGVVTAWMNRKMAKGVSGSSPIIDHATVAGDNVSGITVGLAQSGTTGFISFVPIVNNVTGATFSITGQRAEDGDVLGTKYIDNGGTISAELYLNGRLISTTPYNVTATGVPLTGRFGFRGNMLAGSVDAFVAGNPATDGLLSLLAPNRVLQTDAAGNVSWKFKGEYTAYAPSSLKYRIRNAATGAAVAGHDGLAMTSFAASNGAFTGSPAAAPTIPGTATYTAEVIREGLTGGGAVSYAFGPTQRPGDVIACFGQSLETNSFSSNTSGVIAAPANSFAIQAQEVATLRNQLPIIPNTATASIAATISAATGKPVAIIGGGKGGISLTDRLPGGAEAATWTKMLDGIDHGGGGNIYCLTETGGENDTSGSLATYKTSLTRLADLTAAYVGRPVPIGINLLGSMYGYGDAVAEGVRRAQWEAAQFDARFFIAGHRMDLTHAPADTLHITTAGYVENKRRIGAAIVQRKGLGMSRNGPMPVSVARLSATQIAVTLALGAFDTVEIANGAVNGDWRGGLRFSTGNTFATTLAPISAAIGAPAGGQVVVTYTFAAGSFPARVYVSGPYGANPYNPENNATINSNWDTQASILRGVKSGEPSVGVQPYYAAGGDWISA